MYYSKCETDWLIGVVVPSAIAEQENLITIYRSDKVLLGFSVTKIPVTGRESIEKIMKKDVPEVYGLVLIPTPG